MAHELALYVSTLTAVLFPAFVVGIVLLALVVIAYFLVHHAI